MPPFSRGRAAAGARSLEKAAESRTGGFLEQAKQAARQGFVNFAASFFVDLTI